MQNNILLNILIWGINYSYSWMRKIKEARVLRRKKVKTGRHLSAHGKKEELSPLRIGKSQDE